MRLLIVGSLEGHISAAGKIALMKGAKVTHAEDAAEALNGLRNGRGADLVMIDVKQPIEQFITDLNAERFAVPVVACGIGTDAASAVKAIKAGAKEYVPLPPDAELIGAVLAAVSDDTSAMIASDPIMKQVVTFADKVAPSDATILITGESGTGKEVMSKYIHQKSKRVRGPFISLNCAAIPESLLESELFGHEKGAFTGAVARRIGKFEEANGGTLLLDEVSEMHVSLQAKLLRAIQEKTIDRVGSNQPVKVDIRLIATSNRDLATEVKKGNFREDLYFRLNVINLDLPGLRKRPSDIVPLAQMFADKYSEHNGIAQRKISDAAMQRLSAYHWPGNVRELENTMHRAILIANEAEIEPAAIILSAEKEMAQHVAETAQAVQKAAGNTGVTEQPLEDALVPLVGRTVADVEKELILNTLEHCLGNRTHAANILGISIRTLRNKLNQYTSEGVSVP